MSADHRQTNDPVQLLQVVERLFARKPVTMRDKDGEHQVRVLGVQDTSMQVTHDAAPAQWRLLVLFHNAQQLALECRAEQRADGQEVLTATRLHIRPARREPRVAVAEQPRMPVVANCIPLAAFPDSFISMDRKRDSILRVYRGTLEEKLPGTTVRIHLRTSKRMDHRMRSLNQSHRTLYAPDVRDPTRWGEVGAGNFLPWPEYETVFRYDPPDKEIQSEVAEPLWYRDLYLFGYFSVQSSNELTLHQYELIQKVARKLQEDFSEHECLPRNPALCPVADVSGSGLGFLYPSKSPLFDAGAFMPGSSIVLDIRLPQDLDADSAPFPTEATFTGVVKSIRDFSNAHRFGVQLDTPMTETQRDFIAHLIALQASSGAGSDSDSAAAG